MAGHCADLNGEALAGSIRILDKLSVEN